MEDKIEIVSNQKTASSIINSFEDPNVQIINEIVARNQKKSNKKKLIFAVISTLVVILLCVLAIVLPNGSDISKLWKG